MRTRWYSERTFDVNVRCRRPAAICAFLTAWAALCAPASADPAPRPLLFFIAGGHIDAGDGYTEIEHGKALARVRERATHELSKTFDMPVLDHTFRAQQPSPSDIGQACAQTGAVGAIEAIDAFGPGANDTFRGAFTLAVLDCTGTEFFSETGAAAHGAGKVEIADVVLPAMDDALVRVHNDVADSPKASANYRRYGIYMTNEDTDSFWLPTIDGKQTVVDVCGPLGTASRAGLRVGDDVRSIDGTPTVGIDFEALNAAMRHALAVGSWTLEIAGRDKTLRTIAFQNQNVAWYVAHPLDPATLPARPPAQSPEQRVPLTITQ